MTGQRGFAAGEMEPNGDKRRGFAVGDPARRSRDGTAKERCGVAKPWPRSGQTAPGRFARRNAAPDFAQKPSKPVRPARCLQPRADQLQIVFHKTASRNKSIVNSFVK